MRRLLALLLLLLLPSLASATTLAVTFFDTNTTDERLAPLGTGLAAMLITDLSPLESLTVVERARMSAILDEIALQASPYVDQKTAVQVGKGLGAEWVLTGAVATLADALRIDARLVEVGTGKVLEAASVTGPVDEFFLLEKELAGAILDKLAVRTSARESARMGRVATENFEAFVAWSRGLDALDRGALEDARQALEEALDLDDRFGLATQMLDELREKLKTLDARRVEASDQQTAAVLARFEDLTSGGGPYETLQMDLVPISAVVANPGNARAASTICGKLLDMELPEDLRLGGPNGVYSINEWAMFTYVMAQQYLGRRSDYLTYGNAFLDRYPASVMSASISTGMQSLLQTMKEEEDGRAEISKVRTEAMGQAFKLRCLGEPDPGERLDACRRWFSDADAAGVDLAGDEEEMWARAAARAGAVSEVEQVLARSRAREPYGEAVSDIEGILKRARGDAEDAAEARRKLPEAKDASRVARYARDLHRGGYGDEALAALTKGHERFPGQEELYRQELDIAVDLGRRDLAEELLRRWEAAAAASSELTVTPSSARKVIEWDANLAWVRDADAQALLQLAVGYMRIGQKGAAADTYVELATRYPDYESIPASTALSSAANLYYQAWQMEDARATWERLLAEYPDEPIARSATQMLSLIPK